MPSKSWPKTREQDNANRKRRSERKLLQDVTKAALALYSAPASGIAHTNAHIALGAALVAYNGAPLAYRGRLNKDAPSYAAACEAAGISP
jgi:hypothetical protein